jgi:uncharacterized RDD family membrane protein YckC
MPGIKTQANIKSRAIATIIDFVIYLPIWIGYIYLFGEPNDDDGYSVSGWTGLPLLLIWAIYFPGMERYRGQTIGHIFVGLKVVDVSGQSLGTMQAFKRRILDFIDLFGTFGLIAYITVKNSDKHQRVGDIFAHTIVIGGETVKCRHCAEILKLTPDDTLNGFYDCPNCEKKNQN